jgi:multidrug efflux system membrane fusion protein
MNQRWAFEATPALAAAITLALSALGAGCNRQPPPAEAAVRPVKTTVVAAGGEARVRTFPGRVEASRQAELTFQVPGLIVSLPVVEGQKVAKNDVIAQLRRDEFTARLAALQGQLDRSRAELQALQAGARPEERLRLEAQLRSADANLANARSEFTRAQRLISSRAISQVEFDRLQTALKVAEGDRESARQILEQGLIAREEDVMAKQAVVRGLEAQVVEANLQLEDSTLRAPYDGVIAQRFVEQGQNVQAQQLVVRFQDAAEINIVVDVPESIMAADLRAADIVKLVAEFSAAPGLQFPVHITEIGQRADPVTQTFTIRVAMEMPKEVNLLPGMTSSVTLTYRRAGILAGGILVPSTAVAGGGAEGPVAWIVGPDQTVSRRPVKLGEATGSRIEVLDGLQSGERIVVAGVNSLREGMKVRDLGDSLGGNP